MASTLDFCVALGVVAFRGVRRICSTVSERASERRARRATKVAVYYDAENIGYPNFDEAVAAASTYGRIYAVKIYGNLGLLDTVNWRKIVKREGVETVVCEGAAKGKNSADIRLVIDATMDVNHGLYTDYVIVSNDSDFSPLAKCIRAQGAHAHSIGTDAGGSKYEGAFDTWTILNISNNKVSDAKCSTTQKKKKKSKDASASLAEKEEKGQHREVTPELRETLARIVDETARDNGWATGTAIGQAMKKQLGKTHKDCGFSTLRKLLIAAEIVEFRGRSTADWEARLLGSVSSSPKKEVGRK